MNVTSWTSSLDTDTPTADWTAARAALVAAPAAMVVVSLALLQLPQTRALTRWSLEENHPVEMLTAVFALAAGWYALRIARAGARSKQKWAAGFYLLFGAGMMFTGMEEIAWGQQLFHFATPEAWRSINAQHETTLHNIGPLQGLSEVPRLVFGVGGLIGIAVGRWHALRPITPHPILASWFVVIVVHAAVDLVNDFRPVAGSLDADIATTSEMLELVIAVAAWLYVWMNRRVFSPAPVTSRSLA